MSLDRWAMMALLLVAVGLVPAGCKEDSRVPKVYILTGTVEEIDLANGRVRISYYSDKHGRTLTAEAVVTRETEIFINGIAAELKDVRVGERAEGETVVTHKGDERIITVRCVRIERPKPTVSNK
ncbi:MAG: hypothetical protein KAV82_16690 [Phycisphaerae bacterium]|nr:hypothetical protein [Phycisphaerae bacterium]